MCRKQKCNKKGEAKRIKRKKRHSCAADNAAARASGSKTHRFFSVTRCRENLSSGEKRAGCADVVTLPATTFLRVYKRLPSGDSVNIRCIWG